MIPSIRFDARGVKPAERLDYCQSSLFSGGTLSVPDGFAPETFEAQRDVWSLGKLILSTRVCSPHALHRSARWIRLDQLDHYKVHLRVDTAAATLVETGEAEAARRHVALAAGECIVTDMARPERVRVDRGVTISAFVPRTQLHALLGRPVDLHGVVPHGPCAVLLAAHLQALCTSLPMMSVEQMPNVAQATLHLLAASVAPSIDTFAVARSALDTTLRRQIQRFIEAELTRIELSTDLICSRFRISRSTLYRLFETVGGVAGYIRERRLLRIHSLLSATEGRPHLLRLAEQHGFKTAAHFSRAFREQFGYPPSELIAHGPRAGGVSGLNSPGPSMTHWLQSLRNSEAANAA